MLYIIGFMGFVGSLKRGYLKQQFGLFCWVHMTLLLVVVSRSVCLRFHFAACALTHALATSS
jgi:hypothetical protein